MISLDLEENLCGADLVKVVESIKHLNSEDFTIVIISRTFCFKFFLGFLMLKKKKKKSFGRSKNKKDIMYYR